ncbi:MAG: hypothetical protein FJW23_11325 [Acidimicrobiia bacterium]|nr:hypothetical protein [Acidimicrobiia bacterium]
MTAPAYSVAYTVAPAIHDHFRQHREDLAASPHAFDLDLLPGPQVIAAIVDVAFWTSLRREEGYLSKISLAFVPPRPDVHPLVFGRPIPLDPTELTRLAPAVERPGIHLGVWPDGDRLVVWGTARTIPPLCFVTEVVEPGLLVIKHRPGSEARKFVNVAVLEGDRIKIVDEQASSLPDCPQLLSSLLGFDSPDDGSNSYNVLVQLAVSMRSHGRGGILLVVPNGSTAWHDSIVQPIVHPVTPPFTELAVLAAHARDRAPDPEWLDRLTRGIDAVAGLTAVDGATVLDQAHDVLAFGAKIGRRDGAPPVDGVVVTEPIEGDVAARVHPTQLGGTRHLSAAQFVADQHDTIALVASQDRRFTIFAWSPCAQEVYAHRVEVLLM